MLGEQNYFFGYLLKMYEMQIQMWEGAENYFSADKYRILSFSTTLLIT